MSRRRIVDTNLIVRHLVQDDEKHADKATKLFEACDRGELILVILSTVLAECVFVLESFYKHPRADIARVLRQLIASPGIEAENLPIQLDALRRYGETKIHFVDCLIAATAVADEIEVASFDRDLSRFSDVRVRND
jgi:predicted nucleic-acid-binding protein